MLILIGANLTVTSAMFGVIWIVQLVQYPMFEGLDKTSLTVWHSFHSKQITYIVAPLMAGELILSFWFALKFACGLSIIALIFTLGVWLATFIWSVPLHESLARANQNDGDGSIAIIRKLVRTNWMRTLLYTAKMFVLIILYLQIAVGINLLPFSFPVHQPFF